MHKSILAISEGGPDAAMSFRLAARIASMFGGAVDAVHFSESRPGDVDIAAQAMPFLKPLSADRMGARRAESERAFHELIAPIEGATFTGGADLTRDQLVALGRYASLLLIGRPGMDEENIAPATVRAAIFDCGRPVMIVPPDRAPGSGTGAISSVVVAWNGSIQAARAVGAALPFLDKARAVTIVVADAKPDDVGTSLLVRNLGRRGIAATVDTLDTGGGSGRARGRALLAYARERRADLLAMGAYGHGQMATFLGLGGATAKVIAACPMPLLLAH